MTEENQAQQELKEPQQVKHEPQQVMKKPQRVTTKYPKKVEAGKRLAAIIVGREKQRREKRLRMAE